MGEVNGWVTHTALAIRDEDELEVAASLLDAALRRAKAEVLEDNARLRGAVQECVRCIEVLSMKGVDHDEVHTVDAAIREGWWCSMAIDARTHALVAIQLSKDLDACAAQIEEGSDYGINR